MVKSCVKVGNPDVQRNSLGKPSHAVYLKAGVIQTPSASDLLANYVRLYYMT